MGLGSPRLEAGGRTFLPSGRIPGGYGPDSILPNGARIRGSNILRPWGLSAPGVPYFAGQWTAFDACFPWFVECMDAAASIGCNVVTVFGSAWPVAGGHMSETAYLDAWDAVIAAAEERDLYVYAKAQSYYVDDFELLTLADLLEVIVPWAERIHRTRRIAGIDLVQEGQPWARTTAGTDGRTLYDAVKEVTDLSCTYSIIGSLANPTEPTQRATLAFVDYFDLHWYFDPPATAFETYFDSGEGRRIMIGEFGRPLGDGAAAQETRYQAVANALNHAGDSGRRPSGGIQWSLADYDDDANVGNLYGMFSNALVERTNLTAIFETISKT